MKKKDTLKNIGRLTEISRGFMTAQILMAGNELNIFSVIGEDGKYLVEIINELKTDARGTEILLNALVGMELLKKKKDFYKNTKITKEHLIIEKEHYIGDMLNHSYNLWQSWGKLLEIVKTGAPQKPVNETRKFSEKETRNFILAMSNIGRYSAEELVSELDIGKGKTFLDLGGGPGTYSIAFCKKYPHLKATVFDLKEVTPIAEEQIIKADLKNQIVTLSGNYLKDDIGGPYDLILISNIIHSLGEKDISILFKKSWKALNPYGKILVKDFYPSDNRTGTEYPLIFAVNMLVNTKEGNTYTKSEVKKWLIKSGFKNIEFKNLGNHSGVAIAEK